MKLSVTIFLVLNVFVNGLTNEFTETDINKKRFQKEICAQFKIRRFEFAEITCSDTINKDAPLHGMFFQLTENKQVFGYAFVGRVNSCDKNGCYSIDCHLLAKAAEFFDYLILFNKTKAVAKVVVYNYQASYGKEITAKRWLSQFAGYNTSRNLVVGKNIDAISGATVSVNVITQDIVQKTVMLQKIADTL